MSALRPLLVTGPARSGTTLVARMLAAHDDVEVAVDPLFPLLKAIRNAIVGDAIDPSAPLQDAHGTAGRIAQLDRTLASALEEPLDPAVLAALGPALADRCAIESPDLVAAAANLAGATPRAVLARFLDAVAAVRRARDGAVVGLKEVWAADLAPAFLRAFPEGRVILVRRDPRAVLASNLGMARHDPSQVAHPLSVLRHWRKQEALAAHLSGDDRVAVLAYEELVRDPHGSASRMCGFLGIADDGSMADPARLRDAQGNAFVANSSFETGAAGVAPEMAERWRTRLPEERIRMTEAVCGLEMAAAGIACTGDPSCAEWVEAMTRCIADDHAGTWSWRSDLDEPGLDTAVELARNALAASGADIPDAVSRPLFLFPDALRAARHHHSATSVPQAGAVA